MGASRRALLLLVAAAASVCLVVISTCVLTERGRFCPGEPTPAAVLPIALPPPISYDPIELSPHDPDDPVIRASWQVPRRFWARYHELNAKSSNASVFVFRGNAQGLSNNLLTMVSALVLSVALERRFLIMWNNGGQVRHIEELLSLAALGGPEAVLLEHNTAALNSTALAAAMPGGQCAWNVGCCERATIEPHAVNSGKCLLSLACHQPLSDPLLRSCAIASMSGNLYTVRYMESNPHLAATFESLFGSPVGLVAQRLAAQLFEPAAPVRAFIRANFPNWPHPSTLGVHLRTVFAGDVDSTIACVRRALAQLGLQRVFLATDMEHTRERFVNAIGSERVFPPLNYSITNPEDPIERAASVRFAFIEAVMLGMTQFKVLTLPLSTFSHIVYVLSPPNARVISGDDCSEYPPWTHLFDYVGRVGLFDCPRLPDSELHKCVMTRPLDPKIPWP
eukprot:Amastigsp_a510086_10.p1 type:complete len:451 gc:universal Amastigsp_a510086_10:64-1416(+)